ncbi:LysE family transporter [Massilia sp. PAMC28688]|uniref:LysE family transporter n=1 Tax=Massilia sp. PAMC28688 TaxID=2861283 RepID=UPI001C625FD8|nr:LysE family transporter [Massilia sp. PAMC28688]QYF95254.1 LysE family transporter [Massilia sp. PAMC28688]
MLYSTWLLFVASGIAIALSPGSGAILSMSHGLAYGLRKASATVLGLQLGLLLVFAIAGAGVGSLLVASELAFNIVKAVGALYLIYLGVMQWRAPVRPSAADVHAPLAPPNAQRRIVTGFLTNATNPKGIIFMVAVLPSFINKAAPLLPQLLILGATMVVIDTVVMHGYAYLASSMQRFFRDEHALRLQNRFFGGVLMFMGGALFFFKRGTAS